MSIEQTWHAEFTGGVLSDGAILREVENGRLIVSGFDEDGLHPASYDLTIAPDALITPSGREIQPGEAERRHRQVVLEPGETALFSTKDLFIMPPHIAGNLSIKNRLAAEGLSLLSGLLVDPGYGLDELADDELGCRLFMHVANTGKKTIALHPGKDKIARIQFLPVVGERWDQRRVARASRWSEQQQASLGFLSDLKRLKDSTESNRDLITYVIAGGIFVLLMTMISVALAVILSLSSDGKLVSAANTAVPQSTAGKWLLVALVLGLCVLAGGSTLTLVMKRRR
jgi:deoxycytidine triphosphate deaminase